MRDLIRIFAFSFGLSLVMWWIGYGNWRLSIIFLTFLGITTVLYLRGAR